MRRPRGALRRLRGARRTGPLHARPPLRDLVRHGRPHRLQDEQVDVVEPPREEVHVAREAEAGGIRPGGDRLGDFDGQAHVLRAARPLMFGQR